MNWKDDQIEKLILFYFHNSLFLVPDFWYQISGTRNPATGTRNWYQFYTAQFLVPVSGQ